jgi:hypothetical protein
VEAAKQEVLGDNRFNGTPVTDYLARAADDLHFADETARKLLGAE